VGLAGFLYLFWKIGEGFPTVTSGAAKRPFLVGLFAEEGRPPLLCPKDLRRCRLRL